MRRGGVWLMAAWALCGCSSAGDGQERTWPEWRAPEPLPKSDEVERARAAGAVHGLPEGKLGLRPLEPAEAEGVQRETDPSEPLPWADFPIHGSVFHWLAHVYEAPHEGARAIGYMRRGTPLRAGEEVGREGCERGWYPVWGGGFVCRGQGYRLSAHPAQPEPEHPAPNLTDPLPYRYVKVVVRAAQTWRVPTVEEEADLRALLAAGPTQVQPMNESGDAAVTQQASSALTDGGVADAGAAADADGSTAEATRWDLPTWVRMVDEPGHYLSVAGEVTREDGRTFLRTVRGAFVPREATVEVQAPDFVGHALRGQHPLPVAFAYRDAPRVRFDLAGKVQELPSLARGDVVGLTGDSRLVGKRRYLETRDGSLIAEARVKVIEAVERPALVPRGARWVRVDVPSQTLTAYEGERPVYVTLVSTGKPGFETPGGLHRIHAKHVTATMDDTALSEGAYYIEDVPWTMYFSGSYALHAAFWHERFGRWRSHGCVNLAPRDAHWLFEFLTPRVPGGRHGVLVPGDDPSFVLVEVDAPGESS